MAGAQVLPRLVLLLVAGVIMSTYLLVQRYSDPGYQVAEDGVGQFKWTSQTEPFREKGKKSELSQMSTSQEFVENRDISESKQSVAAMAAKYTPESTDKSARYERVWQEENKGSLQSRFGNDNTKDERTLGKNEASRRTPAGKSLGHDNPRTLTETSTLTKAETNTRNHTKATVYDEPVPSKVKGQGGLTHTNSPPATKDKEVGVRQNTRSTSLPCDGECQAFQKLIRSWPPTRVKGAIYMLVRMQPNNIHRLNLTLQGLDKFVLEKYDYPLIIFYEENKSMMPALEELRSITSSPTFLQLVHFEIPGFLKKPVPVKVPGCPRSIGYRHMCRFQCKLVYEYPITEGLEYMWRMDDDSFIMGHVNFDIFKFMADTGIEYGYQYIYGEVEACIVGLWESVNKYVKKRKSGIRFYTPMPYRRIYFNNFEISKRSVWMSEEYKDYINYIDHERGMYYHRWGDAPIKSLAVSLFVPKNKTFSFRKIVPYHHNIWRISEEYPRNLSIKH